MYFTLLLVYSNSNCERQPPKCFNLLLHAFEQCYNHESHTWNSPSFKRRFVKYFTILCASHTRYVAVLMWACRIMTSNKGWMVYLVLPFQTYGPISQRERETQTISVDTLYEHWNYVHAWVYLLELKVINITLGIYMTWFNFENIRHFRFPVSFYFLMILYKLHSSNKRTHFTQPPQ